MTGLHLSLAVVGAFGLFALAGLLVLAIAAEISVDRELKQLRADEERDLS